MTERRLHPRAIVRLEAQWCERGEEVSRRVIVHDLSASGAQVFGRVPFAIQSEARLLVRAPSEAGAEPDTLDLPCLVVRAGQRIPPDSAMPFFGGLHFLALPETAVRRLQAIVWGLFRPSSN